MVGPTETGSSSARWQRHPWLARLLRTAAWLAPVVASTVAVFVASRLIDRPPGHAALLWWAAMLAWGTLVLWLTDRLARRLLPLAALLNLSLIFPDAAPSRFGLALRQGGGRRAPSPATPPRGAAEGSATDAAAMLAWLVAQLQAHDRLTRGHAERVRAYAVLLGRELGLNAHDADRLQWAALLHDVGKLAVPSAILNKPTELSDEEFELVKTHPAEGALLVEPLRWWLGDWTDAVGQHHEKWDGSGYPAGLGGEDISLAGRIVAVADVFDVLTAARAYTTPRQASAAREELTRCAGTHFDPAVVRAFLSISIGRLHRRIGPLAWLADIPVLGTVTTAATAATAAVLPPITGPIVAAAVAALLVVPQTALTPAQPDATFTAALVGTTTTASPAVAETAPAATTFVVEPTVAPTTTEPAAIPAPPVSFTPTTFPTFTPTPETTVPIAPEPPTTTAPAPPAAPPTEAPTPPPPPEPTTTTTAPEVVLARSDSYSTDSDGLTVDLTLNDSGGTAADPVYVALVRQDSGDVTPDFGGRDGFVTFQPENGFTGTARFTYWIRNRAGAQSSAAVTITVS